MFCLTQEELSSLWRQRAFVRELVIPLTFTSFNDLWGFQS